MKIIAATIGLFMIGCGVFCTAFWSVQDLSQYQNLFLLGGSIGMLAGGILMILFALLHRNTSG